MTYYGMRHRYVSWHWGNRKRDRGYYPLDLALEMTVAIPIPAPISIATKGKETPARPGFPSP